MAGAENGMCKANIKDILAGDQSDAMFHLPDF